MQTLSDLPLILKKQPEARAALCAMAERLGSTTSPRTLRSRSAQDKFSR
jgi:hypothetical protein